MQIFRTNSWTDVLKGRRIWWIFGVTGLVLIVAVLSAATVFGRVRALQEIESQGQTDANLKVSLLRAVLERPRALPFVLSLDRDVEDALKCPGAETAAVLNRKLEDLVRGADAAVIYVTDASGLAIASSNWRTPESFVGVNYAFRPYFSRAMASGTAEHYALGTVSRRPGLYISHRVGPAGAPLGVVVVKMEFDQLEANWSDARRPVFVVDDRGVVLISSVPAWRFMTTVPLAEEARAVIRESLQFGAAPLRPLPFRKLETTDSGFPVMRGSLPGTGETDFMSIAVPVATTPWKLEYLVPIDATVASEVWQARLAALIVLLPALALAGVWVWRRQRVLARIEEEIAQREALERRVGERTADLSLARDRLEAEVVERRAAEARLQTVQQELVQANRLAILGQVAAGVAHEINQPVATIRTFADNARTLIERDNVPTALDNLEQIAALTERIGTITDDLKALSRRGRTAAGAVPLERVIDGAIELLRGRFSGRLETLSIDRGSLGETVYGNQLRLEQVFINLIQNGLEAIADQPDGKLTVSARRTGRGVSVTVADNGPGIAAGVRDNLFYPFNSSKETGLGLGLVICKDIVTDYGGRIDVESDATGTRFEVQLRTSGDQA